MALPVANATAGIALRIIRLRKPSHPALALDKVDTMERDRAATGTGNYFIQKDQN